MEYSQKEYEDNLKRLIDGESNTYTLSSGESFEFTYDGRAIGIEGPMKGGKSDFLINKARTGQISGAKLLALKPSIDTRQPDISSRRNLNIEAMEFDNILDRSIIEKNIIDEIDIICIDEGHFVENIHIFVELMTNMGKVVYVSYLNGSYTQKQFPNTALLLPMLDDIIRLSAKCANCPFGKLRDANYTILCDKNNSSNAKNEILVGDSQYKPVCRKCLNMHKLANYESN